MALVRKRKAAVALAKQMANQFVDNNGHALREASTLDDVTRVRGAELARIRQSFHDKVGPERRGEGLLETAIVARLAARLPASPPIPIAAVAPRAPFVDDPPITAGSYREGPPDEAVVLKPSRLLPPPSALARMRNRLLFAASWVVAVIRFSVALRSHGVGSLALTQGLLGTIAVLPIVLGVLLLLLPKR